MTGGPLLAIDTSTRQASLALWSGRGPAVEQVGWWSPQAHSGELAPRVAQLFATHQLRAADLAAVAVATGPGSFTGLRAGMSLAKGLSLASGVPLLGISTTDALAHVQGPSELPLWAILEAGRGRICAALYRHHNGRWRRVSEYRLTTLAALWGELEGPALLCGEISEQALQGISEAADGAILRPVGPRAASIASLAWERYVRGEFDDPLSLEPLYLPTPGLGA